MRGSTKDVAYVPKHKLGKLEIAYTISHDTPGNLAQSKKRGNYRELEKVQA
jgi:hypothetical protein